MQVERTPLAVLLLEPEAFVAPVVSPLARFKRPFVEEVDEDGEGELESFADVAMAVVAESDTAGSDVDALEVSTASSWSSFLVALALPTLRAAG
jgi:hypothetical protein